MTDAANMPDAEGLDSSARRLFKIAGLAAFVQLACALLTMTVVFTLGPEPETARETYSMLQDDRLTGILRLDFSSLLNVALFALTSFGLFTALRHHSQPQAGFALVAMLIGVAIALAVHSAASMIHLSDQFAASSDEAQRSQLLAAGEAVLAKGWWNSTGGFLAGVFLQGGMTLMSFLMLRSRNFLKLTAYAGILANGLDLLHIFVGLALPQAAVGMLLAAGLFYLIWFPSLGRDLFRLGRLR